MGSRYRKQEEVRINIADGDWLLVRKHLTAGEDREATIRVFKGGTVRPGERPEIDLEHYGIAQVVAYLIDWSITDADGQPIRIRDQSHAFVDAALRNQTPESLLEIIQAIDAHHAAMAAERAHEKKTDGENASSPISTSAG